MCGGTWVAAPTRIHDVGAPAATPVSPSAPVFVIATPWPQALLRECSHRWRARRPRREAALPDIDTRAASPPRAFAAHSRWLTPENRCFGECAVERGSPPQHEFMMLGPLRRPLSALRTGFRDRDAVATGFAARTLASVTRATSPRPHPSEARIPSRGSGPHPKGPTRSGPD
jgi:hypothetical protein